MVNNYGWNKNDVSISSNGTIVACGASYNDEKTGRVQVYAYIESQWIQKGGNIDGEKDHNLSGWAVSISSDGNIVAIGHHLMGMLSIIVEMYESMLTMEVSGFQWGLILTENMLVIILGMLPLFLLTEWLLWLLRHHTIMGPMNYTVGPVANVSDTFSCIYTSVCPSYCELSWIWLYFKIELCICLPWRYSSRIRGLNMSFDPNARPISISIIIYIFVCITIVTAALGSFGMDCYCYLTN